MTNSTQQTPEALLTGSGRDIVLQRIRSGLSHPNAHFQAVPPQPVHPVWPIENPSTDAMAERFVAELKIVQGEAIRCANLDDARTKLAQLCAAESWATLGAIEKPLLCEVTSNLDPGKMQWLDNNTEARQIEKLDASIITVEALLADTGSCVAFCPTAIERLLCYLPPACIVIARKQQLYEHLPAAWPAITKTCTDKNIGGEIVIITGPSRTADIEKILILGVHGPKRLVVLLIDG